MTGQDHETTAAVSEAAHWYASLPTHERVKRGAVPMIRERFGLSASEAIEAIREANLVKARAL